MIISKLYMLFTAGPQIWSWLVYLEQQTIFGMTPMVRGDTLNGIVEATEKEKIIQFKKKKKKAFENDRYIVNDLDHVALFVKQKKVNSCDNILFSLLAFLFAHQSCQSLYIALRGCNRKNFHRLIFHERKFLIFGWQKTPINFELAYLWHLWPTKRSGMWPREFTVLVWQTRSVVASVRVEPEIRDTLHVLAEVLFFTRIAKVCKSEVSVRRRKTTCR